MFNVDIIMRPLISLTSGDEMRFPFDPSDSILYKIAIVNFVMLGIAQLFVLPFLGDSIFDRCKKLGYKMKSNPYLTWFNISGLWREAREFNDDKNDDELAAYLKYHKYFIRYCIVSFLFVVLSDFIR